MTANEAWKRLVLESENKPLPLRTKRGLNFTNTSNRGILIVHSSAIEPSSKLKSPRQINS